MTLPSKDDFASFGGPLSDYVPVEDPTTDRSAAQMNTALADVAMSTRTADRAWCIFTTHATTPTINSHESMWGNGDSIKPTVAHSSTGVYTITWAATQTDALGVVQSLNFDLARAELNDVAFGGFARAVRTAANVVTVYTYNTSFAANDIAGATVKVFVK